MTGVIIARPGLLSTVQDLGRWGSQAVGMPVAGPMDVYAHRLANLLVGNPPSLATIEATLIGPELIFERGSVVAITGADFDVTLDGAAVPHTASFRVREGQHLRFGRRRLGTRAYIGVAGGFETPIVAGSRATSLVAHLGGHEGRALQAGDRLPLGVPVEGPVRHRRGAGLTLATGTTILRVMAGPQEEWFGPAALDILRHGVFRVSPRSNRMGYRLEGASIPRSTGEEPISEPVPMGAIQVPPAGDPILLMADRQTAGGYPKIATVISADLPLAGQLAPGDLVGLRICTRHEALTALIARERQVLHVTDTGPLP
ncbi:MAG: biotin-dependent carboxyltransferase family protein [Vicinamibacterales bacterium]|nr:biotin-dependent carboxyltransferase family protein [Vicinamibacterales bacterium]